MDIAIYLVLALSGLAFIAYPLLMRHVPTYTSHSPRVERERELLAEKEAVYAAIKDVDFEYKTGKLSDDDYAELRDGYRVRALNILRDLDGQPQEPNGAAAGCAFCGHVNPGGSNFCESCGSGLSPDLRCGKCGTAYGVSDRYCGICGSALQ